MTEKKVYFVSKYSRGEIWSTEEIYPAVRQETFDEVAKFDQYFADEQIELHGEQIKNQIYLTIDDGVNSESCWIGKRLTENEIANERLIALDGQPFLLTGDFETDATMQPELVDDKILNRQYRMHFDDE